MMLEKHLWINDKIGAFTKAVIAAYEGSLGTDNEITKEWCFDYLKANIERIILEADRLF